MIPVKIVSSPGGPSHSPTITTISQNLGTPASEIPPNGPPPPHNLPFDPTHGYTWERLLAIQPPSAPEGFSAFWQQTRLDWTTQQAGQVLKRWPASDTLDGYTVERIRFRGWDHWQIEGWIARPRGPVTRGLVVGHGYDGRTTPSLDFHLPGAAVLFPCFRGLGLSRRQGISAVPQRHVLTGITSPHTSILRGCATDVWSATSALTECFPEASARLDYIGSSFAGGVGMLALPWEPRFHSAHLNLPTFGHHRLRLNLPCTGSGHALTRYAQRHPAVLEQCLPFLDPAVSAGLETRPIHYAIAAFDPVVPPPGQAAILNAHSGPKKLFPRVAGHFEHAGSAAERSRLHHNLETFMQINTPLAPQQRLPS